MYASLCVRPMGIGVWCVLCISVCSLGVVCLCEQLQKGVSESNDDSSSSSSSCAKQSKKCVAYILGQALYSAVERNIPMVFFSLCTQTGI